MLSKTIRVTFGNPPRHSDISVEMIKLIKNCSDEKLVVTCGVNTVQKWDTKLQDISGRGKAVTLLSSGYRYNTREEAQKSFEHLKRLIRELTLP